MSTELEMPENAADANFDSIRGRRPASHEPRSAGSSENTASPAQPASGLPRTIAGGFVGVADDLARRSRDWTMMVRLLEQQRLHLETAEAERDRLYASLETVLPQVRQSTKSLQTTIETTTAGDVSGNLSAAFDGNLRFLESLENNARALTANLLWTRSSWEQYARSVIEAQKMREDTRG